MDRVLRVLNVEDSERDIALLTRHLTNAGYELVSERVDTADSMYAALQSREWDIILCDYSMPHFNALAALIVLRKSGLDIPFIIISGTVGEEVAVQAMLAGAHDYLPKDNLTRLVPAIERELQQAENRRVQRETEAALKNSEAEMRALFAAMNDVILVLDSEGRHLKVAPTNPSHVYKRGTYRIGKTVHEIFPAAIADFILSNVKRSLDEARTLNVEYTMPIDGKDLWFDGTVTPMTDDSIVWVARDITERKRAENERRTIFEIIQGVVTTSNLEEFLKLVHRSIGKVVYAENCFVMLHDPVTDMVSFEFWADKHDPPPPPHMAGKGFANYVLRTGTRLLLSEETTKRMYEDGEAEEVGSPSPSWLGVPLRTPARTIGVLVVQHYEAKNAYDERDLEFLSSVGDQIAIAIERKRSEAALEESEASFKSLFDRSNDAIVVVDEGVFQTCNPAAEVLFGCEKDDLIGARPDVFSPSNQPDGRLSREKAGEFIAAAMKGVPQSFEWKHSRLDGTPFDAEVSLNRVEFGGQVQLQGTVRDITERKRAEAAIQEKTALLEAQVNSTVDGILVVDENGRKIIQNQQLVDLLKIPKIVVDDPDDSVQVKWVTGMMKDPEKFVEKVAHLYAHPDEISRDEIELKDGTILDRYSAPVLGKDGKNYGRIWTFRDITEQKRADGALRESETRLRTIIDTEPECVKLLAKDGSLLEMNPAGLRMIEADSFEEVANHSVFGLIAEDDRKAFRDLTSRVFRGESGTLEFQIVGLKGTHRWLDTHASPLRDAAGNIIALLGITRDVTQSKLVNEALQESNEKFQQLVNNIEDAFWIRSGDMRELYYLSPAFEKIWGRSVESLYADPDNWIDFVLPDDRERVMDAFATLTEGSPNIDVEYRITRSDGEIRWVRVRAFQVRDQAGKLIRNVGIVTDTTERKKADQRFKSLLESAPDAMVLVNGKGEIILINSQAERLFGWERKELLGQKIESLVPELVRGEHPRHRKDFFAAPEARPMGLGLELRGLSKDGVEVPIEISLSPIETEEGTMVMAAVRDITERLRVDEAMRESEEKYRTILENIEDGYYEDDVAGNFTFFNDPLCGIFGYSRDEMSGMNNRQYMDDENARKVFQTFNEVYRTGKPAKAFDWEIIRKDGTRRFIEASVSRKDDFAGQPIGFRGIVRDITERKQLEEQFRQSQKMEAIGELAGGIAHDFNNLLTAINGYSDLTLRKMQADDPLRHNVEEVKKAGGRAAELTSQLLAFSRKQVLKPLVHGLNSMIENIEKMLRRVIRENIELRTVLDPELGNVRADPAQIEQVIMNLAVNARDAMPHGGTLTIETQNVYLDEDYVSQNLTIAPGPFVRLTVTDTGKGMDQDTKRHIFEPFFTTKEVGKGTGLGLSMVYGVIKQSGGDIMVYSELGHGTTFKIYLPRVDELVDKPKWAGDREQRFLGSETILLVEDEDVVRNLVREILTENGYHVLAAHNGKEALNVCSSYDKPIHMLLTDVIMPKMSGGELKDEVIKMLPDIKILFMSGYTDDSIANRGVFDADIAFIEKPFTPDALSRKVRGVLES